MLTRTRLRELCYKMNEDRGRRAHENSTTCNVQQGGRGSARGRGIELAVVEARQASMANVTLERLRRGGCERISKDRFWLRWRRMRENDEEDVRGRRGKL